MDSTLVSSSEILDQRNIKLEIDDSVSGELQAIFPINYHYNLGDRTYLNSVVNVQLCRGVSPSWFKNKSIQ